MLSIKRHKNGLFYVLNPDASIVSIRTTQASAQVVVDAGGTAVGIAVADYTDAHDGMSGCAARLEAKGWPAAPQERALLRTYQEAFRAANAALGAFPQAEINAEFVRREIR